MRRGRSATPAGAARTASATAPAGATPPSPPEGGAPSYLPRSFAIAMLLMLGFSTISVQLVRLALKGQVEFRMTMSRSLGDSSARPDILDRHGRLLATDVEAPTLYADPFLIQDVDEVLEKLRQVFPDIDTPDLRRLLSDRNRRFVRLRRGLSPATAQLVHGFGLPGLAFKWEPKRVYPNSTMAGHVLGNVNVDNQGTAGIERYLDDSAAGPASAPTAPREPVRLTIDLAVQHGLEAELRDAVQRFGAPGASGLVLDIANGEVLAAASIPEVDPGRRLQALDAARVDKVADGVYELGSIFKTVTVAMALEAGTTALDKVYDVRLPLRVGPYAIRDLHPLGRPLTTSEIFVHSSNVGAGMMGLELGTKRQREMLAGLGMLEPLRTETGAVAIPKQPANWGRAETITISFGHGLAVSPLQFAAVTASLLNGGWKIKPRFTLNSAPAPRERVLSEETSAALRYLMRRNVIAPNGTGRRAEVPGYEVGGKTGTAEMPGRGGYREKAVIASFVAAFPMSAPKYLVLVTLHEPKPTSETGRQITAGTNAAPIAGQIIARVAPLLGLLPQ